MKGSSTSCCLTVIPLQCLATLCYICNTLHGCGRYVDSYTLHTHMCTHKTHAEGKHKHTTMPRPNQPQYPYLTPTATHVPTILPCVNYQETTFLGSQRDPSPILDWSLNLCVCTRSIYIYIYIYIYISSTCLCCVWACGLNIVLYLGICHYTRPGAQRSCTNLLRKGAHSSSIIEFASEISSLYPRYNNSTGYNVH